MNNDNLKDFADKVEVLEKTVRQLRKALDAVFNHPAYPKACEECGEPESYTNQLSDENLCLDCTLRAAGRR